MSASVDGADRGPWIWLVYALVVLYAFCFQLQAPLEPFLVDKLVGKGEESTLAYGRLQTFFQVVQTIGSLIFGDFLDRFGVRVGLVVNFCACALTYLLLANTSNLATLFLSKVPSVFMAGFLCAQTAISQLTADGDERLVTMGRLTTSYTVGGVLGPYVGGRLGAEGDYFISAKIAVLGSLLAAGLSGLMPAWPGRTAAEEKAASGAPAAQLPWRQRARMILGLAGFLIATKLVTSTANSMASSTQAIILKNDLGFTEADLGFFMSCQFAVGGFANAFLLAPVTRLLGGQVKTVVRNSLVVMAAAYFVQAGLRSTISGWLDAWEAVVTAVKTYGFVGVAMLLSVFQYSLSTSITTESTRVVPEDMNGTLLGIEHGIFAGARILTPSIGIAILNAAGASALYLTCGSIFLAVVVFWQIISGSLVSGGSESSTSGRFSATGEMYDEMSGCTGDEI